jgi:hypothetical protein
MGVEASGPSPEGKAPSKTGTGVVSDHDEWLRLRFEEMGASPVGQVELNKMFLQFRQCSAESSEITPGHTLKMGGRGIQRCMRAHGYKMETSMSGVITITKEPTSDNPTGALDLKGPGKPPLSSILEWFFGPSWADMFLELYVATAAAIPLVFIVRVLWVACSPLSTWAKIRRISFSCVIAFLGYHGIFIGSMIMQAYSTLLEYGAVT